MRTSIYISNSSIASVTGEDKGRKIVVKECHREPLPTGVVHNGTVLDTQLLAGRLGEFFNIHGLARGDVTLVIDADHITSRAMDVPVVARKELMQIIVNEMESQQGGMMPAQQEGEDARVFDYTVLQKKREGGGARIFAVAAEKAILAPYIEACNEAGLRLKGMDITQVCAMRFFMRASAFKGRSFVYTLLDGSSMLSMMFADDEYLFSNRTTLMEKRGTAAAAVEISRGLANMVQYNYARDGAAAMANTYISGLVGEEPGFYRDMGDALNMTVGPVPVSKELSGAYFDDKEADYGSFLFGIGDMLD